MPVVFKQHIGPGGISGGTNYSAHGSGKDRKPITSSTTSKHDASSRLGFGGSGATFSVVGKPSSQANTHRTFLAKEAKWSELQTKFGNRPSLGTNYTGTDFQTIEADIAEMEAWIEGGGTQYQTKDYLEYQGGKFSSDYSSHFGLEKATALQELRDMRDHIEIAKRYGTEQNEYGQAGPHHKDFGNLIFNQMEDLVLSTKAGTLEGRVKKNAGYGGLANYKLPAYIAQIDGILKEFNDQKGEYPKQRHGESPYEFKHREDRYMFMEFHYDLVIKTQELFRRTAQKLEHPKYSAEKLKLVMSSHKKFGDLIARVKQNYPSTVDTTQHKRADIQHDLNELAELEMKMANPAFLQGLQNPQVEKAIIDSQGTNKPLQELSIYDGFVLSEYEARLKTAVSQYDNIKLQQTAIQHIKTQQEMATDLAKQQKRKINEGKLLILKQRVQALNNTDTKDFTPLQEEALVREINALLADYNAMGAIPSSVQTIQAIERNMRAVRFIQGKINTQIIERKARITKLNKDLYDFTGKLETNRREGYGYDSQTKTYTKLYTIPSLTDQMKYDVVILAYYKESELLKLIDRPYGTLDAKGRQILDNYISNPISVEGIKTMDDEMKTQQMLDYLRYRNRDRMVPILTAEEVLKNVQYRSIQFSNIKENVETRAKEVNAVAEHTIISQLKEFERLNKSGEKPYDKMSYLELNLIKIQLDKLNKALLADAKTRTRSLEYQKLLKDRKALDGLNAKILVLMNQANDREMDKGYEPTEYKLTTEDKGFISYFKKFSSSINKAGLIASAGLGGFVNVITSGHFALWNRFLIRLRVQGWSRGNPEIARNTEYLSAQMNAYRTLIIAEQRILGEIERAKERGLEILRLLPGRERPGEYLLLRQEFKRLWGGTPGQYRANRGVLNFNAEGNAIIPNLERELERTRQPIRGMIATWNGAVGRQLGVNFQALQGEYNNLENEVRQGIYTHYDRYNEILEEFATLGRGAYLTLQNDFNGRVDMIHNDPNRVNWYYRLTNNGLAYSIEGAGAGIVIYETTTASIPVVFESINQQLKNGFGVNLFGEWITAAPTKIEERYDPKEETTIAPKRTILKENDMKFEPKTFEDTRQRNLQRQMARGAIESPYTSIPQAQRFNSIYSTKNHFKSYEGWLDEKQFDIIKNNKFIIKKKVDRIRKAERIRMLDKKMGCPCGTGTYKDLVKVNSLF